MRPSRASLRPPTLTSPPLRPRAPPQYVPHISAPPPRLSHVHTPAAAAGGGRGGLGHAGPVGDEGLTSPHPTENAETGRAGPVKRCVFLCVSVCLWGICVCVSVCVSVSVSVSVFVSVSVSISVCVSVSVYLALALALCLCL